MTRSLQSELSADNNSTTQTDALCLAVLPAKGFKEKNKVVSFPLYWLQGDLPPYSSWSEFLAETEFGRALQEVLADPLLEQMVCAKAGERSGWLELWKREDFGYFAERQFLPGVTDNLAKTVEEALQLKGYNACLASGTGFLMPKSSVDSAALEEQGKYVFYHPLTDKFVVHALNNSKNNHSFLTFPAVHLPEPHAPEVIALDLDDVGLIQLSQQRLLALTLAEMKVIRAYFENDQMRSARRQKGLPLWPTDVELEVIAQTWSEHCKHKIFGAVIEYKDGERVETIRSLYKTYIQKPTFELMHKRSDLLSVFEDNAGVVRWNNEWAVCFKVETHNSPSALEPYGGALTGILGVNRDILGTGLGAKPMFNTDVFCFAYPSERLVDRPKLLPPKTILDGVRRGVQDGGNKSGIPTINGAIFFEDNYRGKPLVFCGTGGILPTTVHKKSGFKKHTMMGDTIVMVGGRVGKDGIHGATFSSEALHEGSPVTAVQIGDPFTQKRLLDFIIEARDRGLISGITDNGAGGLSSSVGEMARITNGAVLELDNIPLKYPGLSDWEMVVSESQERMTLSTRSYAELKRLAERYNVEATAIGTFNTKGSFDVTRKGKYVASLDLEFLHEGNPTLQLKAIWAPAGHSDQVGGQPEDLRSALLRLLASPNISSREQVIRQYDHEVQGTSVVKPLMGPLQQAPCDAAVFRPLYEEDTGLVVSNGLCPNLSKFDAKLMAICAVDEAVRNAVCVGADPSTIVILDNFCWPDPVASDRNPDGEHKLAQLVRACEGLAEASRAYNAPCISGKDSMKNDFDDGVVRLSIPPTLLISAMARIENADLAISMDFKSCSDLVYIVCAGGLGLAGSQYIDTQGWSSGVMPKVNLEEAAKVYERLHTAISRGWVKSCHDLSDGGLAVSLAECVIGSGLGAELQMKFVREAAAAYAPEPSAFDNQLINRDDFALFGEGPSRMILTIQPELREEWEEMWTGHTCICIGEVVQSDSLIFKNEDGSALLQAPLSELVSAWKTPLPFD